MKKLLLSALVLFSTLTFAQTERILCLNESMNLIEVIYYHENGAVSLTGFYNLEGELQGEWISFNEEGEKVVLANFDKGNKVGKWSFWTDDSVKHIDYDEIEIANFYDFEINLTAVADNNN